MDKKKILIVDDEEQIRNVLIVKLEGSGFDVVDAKDGKTGLEVALNQKPDLMLLDLVLPEMDGMTLLGRLREDPRGRNLPVIILSNLESAEDVEECRKKGVYDYLVKTDWSLDDVVKKIKSALKIAE